MGSSNVTTNGFDNNCEQCIMLHSPTHPLAGILTKEFDSVWDRSETLDLEVCADAARAQRSRSEELSRQRSSASSMR